jgi:chromosome partitioning protein
MAKFVATAGNKGGTGKSTLAHLIGHGAGSLPHPIDCVVITTDEDDEPVTGQRRYLPIDGRDLSKLGPLLTELDQNDRLLIILDGAAARPEIDQLVQTVADLVLLPYGPSTQEVQRVLKDLERLPEAVALPNRWPTHADVKERAGRFLELVPQSRRLPPIPQLSRTDELLDPTGYARVSTPLSRKAQQVTLEILHRIKVHPYDLASKG